ncbi:MAG: hypothetical protein ACRDPY_33635 [Streptosporangiaceae bacterium]
MATTKPLPSWAWKSGDPGDAWVADIGGIVRPITNEASRLAASGLFFFDTQAHAQDAKAYFGSQALIEGVSVGMVSGTLAGAGLGTPANPPSNPLSGVAAIGDFFSKLGQPNTWIRVGEVALGLILLAVGVARITGAVPLATKIAKTAGTGALLA